MSGSVIVSTITEKLGHALVDIRDKWLQILLSKLDTGVLALEEVIHEHALARALLHWFNFPQVHLHDECFQVIKRIAENPKGALTMVDVGAISFIESFTDDCPRYADVTRPILNILYSAKQSEPIQLYQESDATLGAGWEMESRETTDIGFVRSELPREFILNKELDLAGTRIVAEFGKASPADQLFLPYVKLVRSDEQYLFELDVRLKITDSKVVLEALEELRKTVLDFPAEVFLQNGQVLRTLIGLLRSTEQGAGIEVEVMSILLALVRGLRESLLVLSLPSAVVHERPSAEHSRDQFSIVAEYIYPAYVNQDMLDLPDKKMGMSLNDALHAIMDGSMSLLNGPVSLSCRALDLCSQAFELGCSAKVVSAERLRSYIMALSSSLVFSRKMRRGDYICVALLDFFCTVVESAESDDLVGTEWDAEARAASAFAQDPFFREVQGQLCKRISEAVSRLNDKVAKQLSDICEQIRRARAYFNVESVVTLGCSTTKIEDFEDILPLLEHVADQKAVVYEVVKTCFAVAGTLEPAVTSRYCRVLLKLMAHRGERTQRMTYKAIGDYTAAVQKHSSAGNDDCGRVARAVILDQEVLFQILMFGMAQPNELRTESMKALELAVEHAPELFAERVAPISAILQCHLFGSEESAQVSGWLHLVQQRCAELDKVATDVRFLFHADKGMRMVASQNIRSLMPGVLTGIQNSVNSNDVMNVIATVLEDPFENITQWVESESAVLISTSQSNFKAEDVENLADMMSSLKLDTGLRISAMNQLVVLAKEARFGGVFEMKGVGDVLLGILKSADLPMLEPALRLLESLSISHPTVRRRIQTDYETLLTILPYAFHPAPAMRTLTARALAISFFDLGLLLGRETRDSTHWREDVSGVEVTSGAMPLPSIFSRQFRMPFVTTTCLIPSCHSLPDNTDRLVFESVQALNAVFVEDGEHKLIEKKNQGQPAAHVIEGVARMNTQDNGIFSRRLLATVSGARSAGDFASGMEELVCYSMVSPAIVEAASNADIGMVMKRFLMTLPTSKTDDDALEAVLKYLKSIVEARCLSSSSLAVLVTAMKEGLVRLLGGFSFQTKPSSPTQNPTRTKIYRENLVCSIISLASSLVRHSTTSMEAEIVRTMLSDCSLVSSTLTGVLDGGVPSESLLYSSGMEFISASLATENWWEIENCRVAFESETRWLQHGLCRVEPERNSFRGKHVLRMATECFKLLSAASPLDGMDLPARLVDIANQGAVMRLQDREMEVRSNVYGGFANLVGSPEAFKKISASSTFMEVVFKPCVEELKNTALAYMVRQECALLIANLICISSNGLMGTDSIDGEAEEDGPGLAVDDIWSIVEDNVMAHMGQMMFEHTASPLFLDRLVQILDSLLSCRSDLFPSIMFANDLWNPVVAVADVEGHWSRVRAVSRRRVEGRFTLLHIPDVDLYHVCTAEIYDACRSAASFVYNLQDRSREVTDMLVDSTKVIDNLLSVLLVGRGDFRPCEAFPSAAMCPVGLCSSEVTMRESAMAALISIMSTSKVVRRPDLHSLQIDVVSAIAVNLGNDFPLSVRLTACRLVVCASTALYDDIYDFALNDVEHTSEANTADHVACTELMNLMFEVHRHENLMTFLRTVSPSTVLCTQALGALVSVSNAAKKALVECGFFDVIFRRAEDLHSVLTMDDIRNGPTSSSAVQLRRDDIIAEVTELFAIARNVFYRYPDAEGSCEARVSAMEHGMLEVVRIVWPLALSGNNAMLAQIMHALNNFASHSDSAKKALTTGKGVKKNPTSCVMLVLKLLREGEVVFELFRIGIEMLGSVLLSADARSVILKSGFIPEVMRWLKKSHNARDPARTNIIVNFFINASFSEEGQLQLNKLSGLLDVIMDIGRSKYGGNNLQRSCIFLLRNMAFNKDMKTALYTDTRTLPFLMACAQKGDLPTKAVALSAMWVIMYNTQKVKGLFKEPSVARSLLDIEEELYHDYKSFFPLVDEQRKQQGTVKDWIKHSKHFTAVSKESDIYFLDIATESLAMMLDILNSSPTTTTA